MKKTTENNTVKASSVALSFVAETVKAVDKAKELIKLHDNDFKAAQKDLLAAVKETYEDFKSNGPKGTPGLLVYNACRKQLDLLKKAGEESNGPKEYDAQARFESIIKECDKHDDFAALLAAHFGPKTRKAKK